MAYFTLRLVETWLDRIGLLQALQSQDEQLGVMLVGEWREGYGREASRLQPMYGCCVHGDSLLGWDVRTVLQVVVLAFLFGFEEETSQTTKILLADCLINGGTATNTLTVVMGCACPPVSFGLTITKSDWLLEHTV